jgi:hypothetical protein
MQIEGKELLITPSSFFEAKALEKAIARSLKGSRIDLPGSITEDVKSENISDIINAVLGVAADDTVEACLFKCADRAVVGTEKVTREYFEPVEHRKHYYPIMYEVMMANVGPFFSGIALQFGDIIGKIGSTPKAK